MKRLILGGVKSGKSRFAEELVRQWVDEPDHSDSDVLYLATAESWGDDLSQRIARHRQQRPAAWKTVEEPLNITDIINDSSGGQLCVLLECLTLWMSNLLRDESQLEARLQPFYSALESYQGELILVSNETGMGIMPENSLARSFGDELGIMHQRVAALCDEVVLTVAGLPHYLKQQN